MKPTLSILILLTALTTQAQYQAEEFQTAKLKARYGVMVVYNGQTNSFAFRIEADSVKNTENPNFLWVDGKLLQATIVPFLQNPNAPNDAEQKRLLEAYRKYEQNYIEKELNTGPLKGKSEYLTINNKPMLFWTLTMPKDDPTIAKQLYIFAICFDQMLTFNAPVEKGKNEADIKKMLMRCAETVEIFPGRLQDLNKLYYEVK
jgi:hypothetical protein